jgi:hypothetical protein
LEFGWAEYEGNFDHFVEVGDRWVPPSVETTFQSVDGQPSLWLRLEVVNGVPQCRDLRITSVEGGRQVKGLDLDAVRLSNWVTDIYAKFAWERQVMDDGSVRYAGGVQTQSELAARQQMSQARKGRGARRLTKEFLGQVANVYRDDTTGAPARAVERAFGVSQRTGSYYVQQARHAGLLPPTQRAGSNRGSNRQ